MNSSPDLSKVIPANHLKGETPEETGQLTVMHSEARAYLSSFRWCKGILASYFGFGVGGIFAVFLFHIKPENAAVDEWIWTIVGDLPFGYIAAIDAPNPA